MDIKNYKELIGSVVAMGSGAYLVQTEEEAQEVMESIENATIERVLQDEEFETAKRILELEENDVKRIYSLVDGNEFFVCLEKDFE